ncbi:C6 finger domain protein [Aspergillus sp. HF37]|nr:C6 finger domain protein [Aspergillus sp. HF37]
MLRGRYMIAKFHIGRPYLYKALRIPGALTDDDLEQVRGGLRNAVDWPIIQGLFTRMTSCVPIKFFGQILLFYCISRSPHARLRATLPAGWERWNDEMMRFLGDCAPESPAVAKDLELLQTL